MATHDQKYKAYCEAALRADVGVAIDTDRPQAFQQRLSSFISRAKKLRPEFAALSTAQAPNGKQVWIINNAEGKVGGRNRVANNPALPSGRRDDKETLPIIGSDNGDPQDSPEGAPTDGGGNQQETGQ